MKKTASFICILLALIMILVAAAPSVVFAEEKQYNEKTVTAYLFDMEPTADITLLFDVELPEFPYISVVDFLNQAYVCDFTETNNEDGTFSISDPYGTMIVDAEKDTVFFECYELFVKNDDYSGDSHFEVSYILSMETEFIGECKPLTLDLGKYGFDIVEYDGKVYFPVTILNDIFCTTYCAAEYVDGNLYFLYTLEEEYDAYFDRESLYNMLERDEAMVRLTYNELCFAIDNFYGAPSNALIADIIKEKGLDKTLDEYSDDTRKMKELLLSGDLVDFYVGFSCLDSLFYDGGHTVFFFDPDTSAELYPDTEFGKIWNAFLEELSDPDVDEYSDERIGLLAEASEQYTWDMIRGLLVNSARIEGFEKYKTVKEWDETAVLLVSGDTAVFSFDTFADDVIEPFKWSLDYAAKHKIKSFILDLTVNSGGQTSCLWYILTMITNKTNKTNEACEKAVSTVTGNTYVSNMLIDLNLDG
ncbi:MAG: hypothetical protein IJS94_09060, partial [Clostridia bacterium]|nr:hypothetical protein [Clostridia bacterium]